MPRNGSGQYTRPQADYTPGTTILATSVNSDLNDMAQALTASIARDGQTTPTGNLPMGGFRHTNVANAANRNEYTALGQAQDSSFLWGGTAGGTANALTVSLNPPITAYAAGQEFRFISSAANTGAVTLNVNSLGAVAVNKGDGTVALGAGDLPASAMVTVVHDGTRFRLDNVSPVTTQSLASNGWVRLQNGLLVQWGSATTGATGVTVTFPVTFASVWSVTIGANVTASELMTYQTLTNTSFFMQAWATTTGSLLNGRNGTWMAVGI